MPLEKVSRWDDQGTPYMNETAGVLRLQDQIELVLDTESCGKGTLRISSCDVVWWSGNSGYVIDYTAIGVFAICRDTVDSGFDRPCIYCQLSVDDVIEVRFVPEDVDTLEALFESMSEGAGMNPDPALSDDGEAYTQEVGEQQDSDDVGLHISGMQLRQMIAEACQEDNEDGDDDMQTEESNP